MDDLKTFPELVQEGIALYSRGDFKESEVSFNKALNLRKNHYIPYYYLGLIKYTEQDYSMSDYFYSQALDRNGAPGLIYYARGITAYSAEDLDSAREYLDTVVNQDPAEYGRKSSGTRGLTGSESEEEGDVLLPDESGGRFRFPGRIIPAEPDYFQAPLHAGLSFCAFAGDGFSFS